MNLLFFGICDNLNYTKCVTIKDLDRDIYLWKPKKEFNSNKIKIRIQGHKIHAVSNLLVGIFACHTHKKKHKKFLNFLEWS